MKGVNDNKPKEEEKSTKIQAPGTVPVEPTAPQLGEKETLKQDILKTKAQLNSLASLIENCNRMRTEKKLVISEDPTNKKQEDVYNFAIRGDVVLRVLAIVDDFIEITKSRLLEQQDKLIGEMNKYL